MNRRSPLVELAGAAGCILVAHFLLRGDSPVTRALQPALGYWFTSIFLGLSQLAVFLVAAHLLARWMSGFNVTSASARRLRWGMAAVAVLTLVQPTLMLVDQQASMLASGPAFAVVGWVTAARQKWSHREDGHRCASCWTLVLVASVFAFKASGDRWVIHWPPRNSYTATYIALTLGFLAAFAQRDFAKAVHPRPRSADAPDERLS